ncbi:Protein CBG27126 [Caenorhabditis briggsae]|uniref:Uncharacterized protein n=2 Tax=Caenorhabditis briggsae TaxID=6238 RepID=A0AAE8ZZU2_CAEBR|nr:Protein CBG27126 [Caenorhabditis briggsae]ULT90103.1 hypothetical protein L3Y34_008465 [Caenorhabditis briggsae]CAR99380.1 Protein CBG27126 [Caenorhabditis briggsae]
MGNSISRTRERVEINTRRVLRRFRRSSSREDLRPETLLPQLPDPEFSIPRTLPFVFNRSEHFNDVLVGNENSSVRRIRLPIRVPPPVCPRWSGSVLSNGLDRPFAPPPPDVFLDEGSLLPPPLLPRRRTNTTPPPPVPPRRSSLHQPSDQLYLSLQQQIAIDESSDEELSDDTSDGEFFYESSDETFSEMSSSDEELYDEESVVSNENGLEHAIPEDLISISSEDEEVPEDPKPSTSNGN